MAFTAVEGRRQLLESLAEATDEIGLALASLGAAYEQLDEASADRLEGELFGPAQAAYGKAKRIHAEFATRHALSGQAFGERSAGLPSLRARGFIDAAVDAAREADKILAALQDSPLPVEVGDVELRAGLSEVRERLGDLPRRARELIRTLGR